MGQRGPCLSQGKWLGENKLSDSSRSTRKWRDLGRPPGVGGFGTRPITSHNFVVLYSLQRVFLNITSLDFQNLADR